MHSALLIAAVAFSSLVAGQRGGRDNTIPECFAKVADVFFILDSSSSIYIEDYKEVLEFVSQVVTRFDVSRDDTRIGALTFSDDFQVGFDLDRFRSKGEVLAGIDERTLPYRTGVTNTDQAIRYVRENVIFRTDITKVMVVITDGGSRNPYLTQREADLSREAGFHMVVVGVGQYLDEQEWRYIASDPDNDYVFNITNFNFLDSLRDALPRRICLMPPIILEGECRVSENADLFFLAAPNGLNDALDLADSLAGRFISNQQLRVRYVMEECRNAVDNDFAGTDRFCERFGDAITTTPETYVNLLRELRQSATELRADRSANQVAVLFVDDQSMRDNRFGILQETRYVWQSDGIKVFVVDLGVREYSNFVRGMIENRDDIIDFQSLDEARVAQELQERICDSVNFRIGEVRPV